MKKLLIKTLLLLLAAAALLTWLRADATALGGGGVLGMEDRSGWLSANSQNPRAFDILEALEAGMLRVSLDWTAAEPAADAYAWAFQSSDGFLDYDQLLRALEKRGVRPVLVLEGGPVYSNHLYPQQPVPRDQLLARWEAFVRAAVTRFGKQVHYWQVGAAINDADAWGRVLYPGAPSPSAPPDPGLYGEMLKRAYSIIKAAQPSDTVILGGLAFGQDCAFHPLLYLKTLDELDLWYAFDVINLDLPMLDGAPEVAAPDACGQLPQAQTSMPLTDSVKAVREFVDAAGRKAVWVGGLGFSAEAAATHAGQAGTLPHVVESDYLTRASTLLLAYGGADKVFWRYAPQASLPGAIALQSYANLSRALGGANLNKTLARFEGQREEVRFRSGGKLALLTWQQAGEPVPTALADLEGYHMRAFSTDAAGLKNKNGVDLPVDAGGGSALMVGERPVLIIGQPKDLKSAAVMFLQDYADQAAQGLRIKAASWAQAQKARAADKVGAWVEEQQKSLLDMMRESFSQWLRKSLGLAKM